MWVVGGGGDGGRGSVGLGDGVGGERGSSGENPPRHGEGDWRQPSSLNCSLHCCCSQHHPDTEGESKIGYLVMHSYRQWLIIPKLNSFNYKNKIGQSHL